MFLNNDMFTEHDTKVLPVLSENYTMRKVWEKT